MTPAAATKRTLSTAEERREEVLSAAMQVFGERGFLGTPTIDVAKAAGISQAYLFRLFPSKLDLILAVVQRSNEAIRSAFIEAAAQARADGRDVKEAMGEAYGELLADRRLLLTQIHMHAAAAAMPEVAEASRAGFADLFAVVERETGLPPEGIQSFFAHGMLMNVMAAIGADGTHGRWAEVLRVC
ncbi:TetR/AcrR family transcriptional regulator [Baekduia soli]|uniref:TetR/AcrR family transcriptional regulator n=1 Tax=Baekduia soli TaxID=496014 RepID=A0A5B8U318_9ACTN|nr:TetR/AcrR family transcriptional regulator [Baekduia soli]QEC47447.1 TetR/AcrR family transcriptional regulator [Baekduia soli]